MTEPPDPATCLHDAFVAALDADRETLVENVADICAWGLPVVLSAVRACAAVVLKGLTGHDKPDKDSFYSIEVADATTGELGALDQVASTPTERAVLQTVALYGNRDYDTAAAIVKEFYTEDQGYGAELVMCAFELAALIAKACADLPRPDVN